MNAKKVLVFLFLAVVLVACGGADATATNPEQSGTPHEGNLTLITPLAEGFGVYRLIDGGDTCIIVVDEIGGTIGAQGGAAIDCDWGE